MTPNDKLKIGDRMAWLTMSTDPRGDEKEGLETKCCSVCDGIGFHHWWCSNQPDPPRVDKYPLNAAPGASQ